ncbi:MAG: HAD family hydrolase [Candidatus Hadarchaeales archaeon]
MQVMAILFDLDGVLVDTLDSWFNAFNDTYRKYGLREVSRQEFIEKYWGHSTERGVGRMGKEAKEYCHAMHMEHLDKARLIDGSRELLDFCKEKFRTALVTNTPRRNTLRVLEAFGLQGYFDVLICSEDVHKKKPDPEMILEACERLGVFPENAILIGDTVLDVMAGHGAGCRVVGINVASADWNVKNLKEARVLIERMLKQDQPKNVSASS